MYGCMLSVPPAVLQERTGWFAADLYAQLRRIIKLQLAATHAIAAIDADDVSISGDIFRDDDEYDVL